MILVLVVAAVVAIVAVIQGGSIQNLAATKFGWVWVLVIALVLQILGDRFAPRDLPQISATRLLVVSYAGVALFLLLNRALPGMVIAAIGLAMNAIVIFVNDAMPVSRWAARIAGATLVDEEMGIKHEIAGPDTVLSFLADVIPIPATLQIVSAGDVVLAIGFAVLVYRRTREGEPKIAARRAFD